MTPESGPERIGDHGDGDAGFHGRGQKERAGAAIALYESGAEHRPPGWPAAGAGALCVLAAQGRADTIEGDIARLLVLAKDMRACTVLDGADRRDRMKRRAERRRDGDSDQAGSGLRLAWKKRTGPPRWETNEQRRQRLRDELLLADEDPSTWTIAAALAHRFGLRLASELLDPALVDRDVDGELDGARARQRRYAEELRCGLWDLPVSLRRRRGSVQPAADA